MNGWLAGLCLIGIAVPSTTGAQPAAQDVQAAANAFAEGQRAQLRHDYAHAAEMFEIADTASPNPAALRSAIRNHRAAGHKAQAASLAVQARERYAGDATTRRFADGVVAELSPELYRTVIRCSTPCVLAIDSRAVSTTLISSSEVYLEPGEHRIEGTWTGRPPVAEVVRGAAGQTQELVLVEPAAPPPPPPTPEPQVEPPPPEEPMPLPPPGPAPARSGGISPVVFWIGLGATAVTGGLLIWSGLDTLSARDDYVDDPTEKRYDDGVGLELRTNILIGAAGALAAATLLVGIFATDWGGAPQETAAVPTLHPTVDLTADRLVLGLGDSF